MVQEYFLIRVETHDEFDDEFCEIDSGDKVNPAECIQDMWNDKPSDYYNFRIEDIEEFVEFKE